MKKLFALLLAVMMTATLAVPAFAATAIDGNNATSAAGKDAGDYSIGVNGTYVSGSAADDVISVDISWGAMNFTYTDASQGTWDPETHGYIGATEGGWSTNKPGITVTNHSNVGIEAAFSFTAADGVTTKGSFYASAGEMTSMTELTAAEQKFSLATAVGTTTDNAPADTLYFGISGDPISENKSLGNITVKIAKDTKIYTGEALAAALTALGETGGTITLGADVTLPFNDASGLNAWVFTVEDNKSLVLDLNGHTVTGILGAYNNTDAYSPSFTVKNGNLQYTSQASAIYAIISTRFVNVFIEDVTVTASGVLAVANIGADMTITDCTFSGGVPLDGQTVTLRNISGDMAFDGEIILNGDILNEGGTIKATAGTYNFNPAAYVDTDYTVMDNNDGTWTVLRGR